MAQRFWGIYQSLRYPKEFPMPPEELDEFMDHIISNLKSSINLNGMGVLSYKKMNIFGKI